MITADAYHPGPPSWRGRTRRSPLSWAVAAMLTWMAPAALALQPDKAFHHHVRSAWSIQNGLPQISVYAITQDRDGYLWVGTQGGLARFDGVRFMRFSPETDDGLSGVWVRALHPGEDGRLWVGTYRGLSVHDGVHFVPIPTADPALAAEPDVAGIAEAADGTLWVATDAGLLRVHEDRLHAVPGAPTRATAVLAHGAALWAGDNGGVHHGQDGTWRWLPLPADAAAATVNRLLAEGERLWAATALGLYVLEQGRWRRVDAAPHLPESPVELLFADRDGNLWAGGDAGLARLRDGRVVEFVPAGDEAGIPNARSAFEDREGSLWLGSQSEGLTRVSDGWTRRYSVLEGLNERIVWSLAPDPDGARTWIGGNDGLSLLADGRIRLVVPGSALPHPHAYNLLAERERLWIGTRRGLAVLDQVGAQAGRVRVPRGFEALASLQINGLLRTDVLWIATSDGLFARHADGDLRRYGVEHGLADAQVRYVHRTRDGRLLAGTRGGLHALQEDRFVPVGADAGLPADQDVTAIGELADGRLVVGTLLDRTYYEHEGRWYRLGEEEGLPGNAPFFLAEHAGMLWIGGIRGITRVSLADLEAFARGTIERVDGEMLLNERGDPNRGQQGYCCNGAGTAKGFLRDDAIWLPTRDGVVALDTGRIATNPVVPTARVERMQVETQWHPAALLHGRELPPGARDVAFEFSVLSLQDPKSVQLEYRLGGYDREWRSADPLNRNVRYTNLPPGDYVFQVRGSNNAGVPAEVPGTLPFSVRPRFHESAAFVLLLAAAALALLATGYRLLQHRHRLQQAALESLVQQRTEALEQANRRLEEVSHTDALTGLRNRRYLAARIGAYMEEDDRARAAGADPGPPLVFALVDVDAFKAVNDRHGHRAGDRVLQQFAQVLAEVAEDGDAVARWGGEEFLLVLRPRAGRGLALLGRRLRDAVAERDFGTCDDDTRLRLTCSIGLCAHPFAQDAALGWDALVDLADRALYHVKSHGRDGWAAFRPTPSTRAATLMDDVHAGHEALLLRGELELVVALHGGEPVAYDPAR